MSDKLMPPRKRDWTPGTYQVGAFIRTPDGSVLEMSTTKPASKAMVKHVLAAINNTGVGSEEEEEAYRIVDEQWAKHDVAAKMPKASKGHG